MWPGLRPACLCRPPVVGSPTRVAPVPGAKWWLSVFPWRPHTTYRSPQAGAPTPSVMHLWTPLSRTSLDPAVPDDTSAEKAVSKGVAERFLLVGFFLKDKIQELPVFRCHLDMKVRIFRKLWGTKVELHQMYAFEKYHTNHFPYCVSGYSPSH